MAVDRPTFHEAWYRVAGLRPRLLSGVRVHRQHFRGQPWYILENPANDQYSRISEEGYRFIGLLNGRRTVSDVWRICNEQLGDRAPTQGEAIQLLGQLHAANLLYVELAPDSEALFTRYRKRVTREVQNYLMNLLFLRIPLLDPNRFLDRWVGIFGRLFSWVGLVLWLALVGTGLYFVIGDASDLIGQSSDVLDPGNLVFLYLSFTVIKILHEFSHAFACKRFGRLNGSGGEVHKMGVMFLVLFPLPYVDASSAWAFRNKWHRAIVGMAGVMAELALRLDRGDGLGLHLHRHAPHHRLQRHLRRQRLDGPVQRQPAAAVRRLLRAHRPDRDPQPGPALPAVLSPISADATRGASRRSGTRRTRWGSVSGSSATALPRASIVSISRFESSCS